MDVSESMDISMSPDGAPEHAIAAKIWVLYSLLDSGQAVLTLQKDRRIDMARDALMRPIGSSVVRAVAACIASPDASVAASEHLLRMGGFATIAAFLG